MLRPVSMLAVLLFATHAAGAEIVPFRSDGCSSFPDGTPRHRELWLECCTAHDRAYWAGGTREERAAADEELRRCVARVGEPEIARVMLAGVRVGGSPWWPTEFRWGYGWPWPRGYGTLTDEERGQIRRMLVDHAIR